MNAIADSGFIIALFERAGSKNRLWARERITQIRLPAVTTAANLHEAGHVLDNHEGVMRMVIDGDLILALDFQEEALNLHRLMKKYAPRMDLADAAIVRLSELYPDHTVLTVDETDFTIYRRFGREKIKCDFPIGKAGPG
jgi:hypothetical protein